MSNITENSEFNEEFYEKGMLLLVDKGLTQFKISLIDIPDAQEKKAKTYMWISSLLVGAKIQIYILVQKIENIATLHFDIFIFLTMVLSILSFWKSLSSLQTKEAISVAVGDPYNLLETLHKTCCDNNRNGFYYSILNQISSSLKDCHREVTIAGKSLIIASKIIICDIIFLYIGITLLISPHYKTELLCIYISAMLISLCVIVSNKIKVGENHE